MVPEQPEGFPAEPPGDRFNVWLKEHLSRDHSLEEGSPELGLPPVIFFQMSPEQSTERSAQPPDDRPEDPPQLGAGAPERTSEPWAEGEGSARPEDQDLEEKPPDSGAEGSCDTSQGSPDVEGKDMVDMGDEQGPLSLEPLSFEISDSLPTKELAMNM